MQSPLVPTLLLCCTAAAQPPVDFQRDVRPILSDACFACHGPDAAERKAGLRLDVRTGATAALESGARAVVPGNAAASELLRRIGSDDPDERMPPPESGKQLGPQQRDVLRRWIEQGATWDEHWSFVPPRRPSVPPVVSKDWVRTPIDAFVLARLEDEGLEPRPESPRAALLRRATLDLTGLPPTLAELDAFLADPAPDAYERAVDRLLASPRFGEHRARYWLDAARYGDTHGYHLDNYRSIWPYRDWVVAAFNDGKRFDEFTVEQLAGDLLPEPSRAQRIATGFNRCNPTTAEGGLIEQEYLAHYASERVETTSTVWLGLTIGCARCHDHKFDPISQREFYRLFAFFNNVDEEGTDRNVANPRPAIAAPTAAQERELEELRTELDAVRVRLAAPMPDVDARQRAWEAELRPRVASVWTELAPTSALSRGGATMRILDDRSVRASGLLPAHDVYEIVARTELTGITAIRLEALADAEQPGGGVGRDVHNNIVLTGVELEVAPAERPLATKPVELTTASADWSQPGFAAALAIDDDADTGWAIDEGDSEDRAAVFGSSAPFGFGGGTMLRVSLRFESGYPRHTIARLRLSVSADPSVGPATLGAWELSARQPAATRAEAFARGRAAPDASWSERSDLADDVVHALPPGLGTTRLRRVIRSPNARSILLSLGSDDAIRVLLGGNIVLEHDVARPVARDQERVRVELAPGDNLLELEVADYGGGHGFAFRVVGEDVLGVPNPVARAIARASDARSPAESATLRDWFRRRESPEWQTLDSERVALAARVADVERAIPTTLVMAERSERRPAHVLIRGKYDQPGERVEPGVPSVLPPLREDAPVDRLALARWLVDPTHPLTARVAVNRFWQSLFGVGIVETAEDFGSQGTWPSHPELLDWLAREFVESGWDVKHVFRLIATSAVYRQRADAPTDAFARDPGNRLLARGPRFRLDAEAIRDQALALSGLLVNRVGGPPVKPYQPDGLWRAVAYPTSNTSRFERAGGDALWRRSVYTFWKRTSPPPSMQTLDAPSRESCRVRRTRTNTPLQALVLLNDVQFVEAARGFAVRILREGGATDGERTRFAFRAATAREPDAAEQRVLSEALRSQLDLFDDAAARELLAIGEAPVPADLEPRALAAWTAVAALVLNLDETLTKG